MQKRSSASFLSLTQLAFHYSCDSEYSNHPNISTGSMIIQCYSISIYLSTYLFPLYLSIYLSTYLFPLYLSIYLSISPLSIYLFPLYLSIYLFIYLSISPLSIYLSIYFSLSIISMFLCYFSLFIIYLWLFLIYLSINLFQKQTKFHVTISKI
ncbi:unnamed protein product [Acanthosepion pharaonis]|uniref:Uncharacterized protein n=1 Tax=Acanthosepion pharaonis TaxID=158019 RepID=A0A812AV91_ACAPH|nr:unnamed protein product [Sepia pharaonis]